MTFFDMRTRWRRIAQDMDDDEQEAFLMDAYDVFRMRPWLTIAAHTGLLALIVLSMILGMKRSSDALCIALVAYIAIYWISYMRKTFRFMAKWENRGDGR